MDVAAITNAHLFGEAPQPEERTGARMAGQLRRRTSLPLVLVGIIAADDPQDGLAILGENAAGAKVYAVGDNVPGGAKLHQVLADKVIIDRNGVLESLMLPRALHSRQRAAPLDGRIANTSAGYGPDEETHYR